MADPVITAWHRHMIGDASALAFKPGTRLVTGCPVWGDAYVDNFLRYCLPSILAPRNRAALESAGWELVLFVDRAAMGRLHPLHIPVRLMLLPEGIDWRDKYGILHATHNLLIHKARDAGAGFHLMVADQISSDGYFERLLKLAERHEAVVDSAIVADAGKALPQFDTFRLADGSLPISCLALSQIAYATMASLWASCTMDDDTMPSSRHLHIRGRRSFRVHCSHKNISWMSNSRCHGVTPVLNGTVDSELPRYVGGDFYVPGREDAMITITFWNCDGTVMPRLSWDDYVRAYRAEIGGRYLPFWATPSEYPLPLMPEAPDDAELDARFERLLSKLGSA